MRSLTTAIDSIVGAADDMGLQVNISTRNESPQQEMKVKATVTFFNLGV